MSKEELEFSLEDIMREFSDSKDEEETPTPAEEPEPPEEAPAVTDDTVRLEQVPPAEEKAEPDPMEDTVVWSAGALEEIPAEMPSLQDEEHPPENPEEEPEADADTSEEDVEDDEDDEDDESDEGTYRAPILFRPRSRIQALKHDIIEGPEKRYYELAEQGVGKLQIAMAVCMVVVLLCGGAAFLYAAGQVPENRMRLLVYSQVLAMLIGGLMASQLMIDGVADLFRGRFTLNFLLTLTFLACCADSVLCLKEVRVPVCASFTLEVFMALWADYHRRTAEMGQMDTLRKATRLDGLGEAPGFPDGRPGFLSAEGTVADFMENYRQTSPAEKVQQIYGVIALLTSAAIAVVTSLRHGASMGVQIFSTALLAAVPGTFFVTLTRPFAVLERRLHSVGAVICGWQGVKRLCRKAVFPLTDGDLFPPSSVKMNGVKFYGEREPEQVIAYAGALMEQCGGNLQPIFRQLMESRDCVEYEPENLRFYGNGGIGGEICGEPVLMGSMDFLKEMGVELPEGTMVKQAVYVSVDGELAGLFAITYPKSRSVMLGLSVLAGCRSVKTMVLAKDFMLTAPFLKEKFGGFTRKLILPERQERENLAQLQPDAEQPAMALTTQDTLLSRACAITGAKAYRGSCNVGLVLHILGGVLGLLIMAAVAVLGDASLLTPAHVLLYQLVWMLPGFLVTLWARG